MMPLSRVQLSPLSVRITGWLTVTLAAFGRAAAVCAMAPDDNSADRARTAELTKTRELDINETFQKTLGGDYCAGAGGAGPAAGTMGPLLLGGSVGLNLRARSGVDTTSAGDGLTAF